MYGRITPDNPSRVILRYCDDRAREILPLCKREVIPVCLVDLK